MLTFSPDGLNPIVLLFLITGIGLALGCQTACALLRVEQTDPCRRNQ